jgi:hypothetical protein
MEYGSEHRNARLGMRSIHGLLCYRRTKTSDNSEARMLVHVI